MNKKVHGRENDSVEVMPDVAKSDVALREEVILSFWQEHDIFNKSLATPAGQEPKGDFVFYDGPPFATGLPHYGHILASTIKDAIPRFWTMQGYRVRRKWGWDCHGLPLENLIEKKLGLATKRDIEEYGVKNFNEAAREAVLEYADDWKKIIPRMGRWADMENDYKTMDSTYTESVWWVFSELHKKGLVFEGFKTMHLCPRCGTTLSNFEVNLGYKDIKDIAVTVKLPLLDEKGEVTNENLLVWTTTPWTLPGNLAAAVNADFDYVKIRVTAEDTPEELLILAKGRLAQLGDVPYEIVEEIKGADLVGRSYQPPFPFMAAQFSDEQKQNAFKIWHADYVELGDEGTGAVHIAPAFGDDDMQLAKANTIPIIHHVDESGHFKEWVEGFECQLVKPKDNDESGVTHLDADIDVVRALQTNGTLLKKENITHSYPHCWRCDTPLLNYATTSWFVDVPQIKDQLVAENAKVNWVPEHVGTNRFGKWLEGARDWAVSRQRYWGAPLPIWKNPQTNEYKVFGSIKELQEYVPKSGNRYFTMRHGESESNVSGIVSAKKDNRDGMTDTGREQVAVAISAMETPDIIIHSGYQRTRETAEQVAAAFPEAELLEDVRLGELDVAKDFEGKTWQAYNEQFASWTERYTEKLDGMENRRDGQVRMGKVIFELEKKYTGKKILLVSHGGPLFALECAASGCTPEEAKEYFADGASYHTNAEVRELAFVPYPHNDHFELDFHRPYIDDFLVEENGVRLERVLDVFDCWFESGSMPYGQHHYPFACDEKAFAERFPAQFIAEGLDQTRGWFYSLIVLGVALFGKSPYENVIVNGLVLAEDGKKMSKSLQNYPDPMELADRTGVDAMRLYMLQSPIMRAEDLNFSEKEVLELQRKNIGRLHNVLAMYEMYADGGESRSDSPHILDRWIIARLNQVISESTEAYKIYELDKATRPMTGFIDDLSVWYVRRSRDRFKSVDTDDQVYALATLRHVLQTFAKIMAPAMPFYAEYLWQQVKGEDDAESVHLSAWPEASPVDPVVFGEMSMVREFVTTALELRTKSGHKVRQPLSSLTINVEMAPEYLEQIADEINVKAVRTDTAQNERVTLDTTLTPELLAEGAVRELMRAIQDARKKAGLQPQDSIRLTIDTSANGKEIITAFKDIITTTVGAETFSFDTLGEEAVKIETGEHIFAFTIDQ